MKQIAIILCFVSSAAIGQLPMDSARAAISKYEIGSYSYHQKFIGHEGYGAPVILTPDGGAALFGDQGDETGRYGLFIKLNSEGVEEWRVEIRPQFDEIESQSVLRDNAGNYYLFVLSFNYDIYRGGTQRIICIDNSGEIAWDKTLGDYGLVNSPTISYIRLIDDKRILLRGHIVSEKPAEGSGAEYRYWDAWIDNKGMLTQEAGKVIDWANHDWEKRVSPE